MRLHDLGTLRPELKELTESIRHDVYSIRNAVYQDVDRAHGCRSPETRRVADRTGWYCPSVSPRGSSCSLRRGHGTPERQRHVAYEGHGASIRAFDRWTTVPEVKCQWCKRPLRLYHFITDVDGKPECGDCHLRWCHDAYCQRRVASGDVPSGRRPRVVCLCGSTRFYDEFQRANYRAELRGEPAAGPRGDPMKVWGLFWDWDDWSLSRWTTDHWLTMFALRCQSCRRFTLGCGEHWLCGLCTRCDARV